VAVILTAIKKVTLAGQLLLRSRTTRRGPAAQPDLRQFTGSAWAFDRCHRPGAGGRFHALDSYVTWLVTDKLTLAAEADYAINRVQESPSVPRTGGAAYARYQFTPKFAMPDRAEYFSDRGGLFSGVTQAFERDDIYGWLQARRGASECVASGGVIFQTSASS